MPTKQSKTDGGRLKGSGGPVRPLAERLAIAREINAYRKLHKDMTIEEVMKKFPGVSESNYWSWRKRLELAEATRKANGAEREEKIEMETHSFPLSLIPERETRPVRRGPYKKLIVGKALSVDNGGGDTNLVASLLEVLAKHLRR